MSVATEKAAFAVIVASPPSNYRRIAFVSARSLVDAYTQVLAEETRGAFQSPRLEFEGFVIGPEMLRHVLPDVKAIAKAYWMEAYRNANDPNQGSEEDFEAIWDQHGPSLVDEE